MIRFLLVTLITITSLFFIGCNRDDDITHAEIIGFWDIEGNTRIYTQEDSLISYHEHPRNRTARFTEDHKYEFVLSVPDQNILIVDSAYWRLLEDLSKFELDIYFNANEYLTEVWTKEFIVDTISQDIIKFHRIALNCSAQGFDNVICEYNYTYHRI